MIAKNVFRCFSRSFRMTALLLFVAALGSPAIASSVDEVVEVIGVPVSTLKASQGKFADCVNLSWGVVVGAIAYRIYRRPKDCRDCDWGSPIKRLKNTSFNDTATEPGKKYEYLVTAELDSPLPPLPFDPDDHKTWGFKKERPVALRVPVLQPLRYAPEQGIRITWTAVPQAEWYSIYIFEADQRISALYPGASLHISEDSIKHLATYARADTNAYTFSLELDDKRLYYIMLRAESTTAVSGFSPLLPVVVPVHNQLLAQPEAHDLPAPGIPGEAFFQRYLSEAIAVTEQHRIPTALLLAIAAIETGYGQTELATRANNFFSLEADPQWNGPVFAMGTVGRSDEATDLTRFRQYDSPDASFRDFAKELQTHSKYHWLFNISSSNYRDWASALQQSGFTTDPYYADKLIKVIERYRLYQYHPAARGNGWRKPTSATSDRSSFFEP